MGGSVQRNPEVFSQWSARPCRWPAGAMVDDRAVRDLRSRVAENRSVTEEIKDNLDHNNRTTRGTIGTNDTKAKGASKY